MRRYTVVPRAKKDGGVLYMVLCDRSVMHVSVCMCLAFVSACVRMFMCACVRTWLLPPVLSCTAVLDRAVLATKLEKNPHSTLLTPNASNSCGETRRSGSGLQ